MGDFLYPLKFVPIIQEKIWGGDKLKNVLNKPVEVENAGESWEISGLEDNPSIVSNGKLKNNNLIELIEVYMGDLVGDRIYNEFGLAFPLLIKFIDATQDLSIQVHPDNKTAKELHGGLGKTEMWHIIDAEPGAKLIAGLREGVQKEDFISHLERDKMEEIVNYEKVSTGDTFFLPAGSIHSIGAGILLAEIQQSSNITYRVYDFNRVDKDGNKRELHIDEALGVIDYDKKNDFRRGGGNKEDEPINLVSCPYFKTNRLKLSKELNKDINQLDSFVIYMCIDGKAEILYNSNEKVHIEKGETILIPAGLVNYTLMPQPQCTLLEVYIDKQKN